MSEEQEHGADTRPIEDTTDETAPSSGVRHPLLVGFALGGGMAILVGAIVFFVARGQRGEEPAAAPAPSPPVSAAAPRTPPANGDSVHGGGAQLGGEAAQRAAELEERIAADPDDLEARNELAYLYLRHQQFVPAFNQTKAVLASDAENPTALSIQALVRLRMGQETMADELLGTALDKEPDNVLALLGRGLIQLRAGDTQGAVASWEKGLEAAGGQHPELERLLAASRAASLETTGSPPAAASKAPGPPAGLPAPSHPSGGDGSYKVNVELAEGVEPPPDATLFISLTGHVPGPPAAVKKISHPTFPLEVVLGPADSMMGQPLPEEGRLKVHLDRDGNASTQGEDDLWAEVDAKSGGNETITLGPPA